MKTFRFLPLLLLTVFLLSGCAGEQAGESTAVSPPSQAGEETGSEAVSSPEAESAESRAREQESAENTESPEGTESAEETKSTEETESSAETESTEETGIVAVTIPGLEEEPSSSSSQAEGDTYSASGSPAVALTFDDGPQAGSTDAILDVLEEYGVSATFFIVGESIVRNPDALRREAALGCELGTHTRTHRDLTTLSPDEVKAEIDGSIQEIEEASGGKVTVIRPPYGAVSDEIKEMLDLPIVLWSVDSLDWKMRDAQTSLEIVQSQVAGGSIILMHDIYEETAEMVRDLVPWLLDNGYRILTVSDLYRYYEVDLSLHKAHGSAD